MTFQGQMGIEQKELTRATADKGTEEGNCKWRGLLPVSQKLNHT